MPVTACVAESYASWQPPDEPLTAPPAQGAQAVMRTLYLLVQQLASRHKQILTKKEVMKDMTGEECSSFSTAILLLEKSLTAKQALLGKCQLVVSCDSLVIFCTVVQPFLF